MARGPDRLPGDVRSRAAEVIGASIAVLAYGAILVLGFDPGVETLEADELVRRSDDANAFLIADLFYPLIYGVLLPLAIWRFAGEWWARAAALLFLVAGAVDWLENGLLLTATDSVSEGTVDAAHLAGVVNVVLFVLAALPGLVLLARAVRAVLRT